MAISLALLGFGFRSLSAIFCGVSWYAYSKKEEEEEQRPPVITTAISTITTVE